MKKKARPGKLCIPGGHLASGESYLEAAKKELQEEEFHNQELPRGITFEELYKIKKSTDEDYEFNTTYRVICSGPFSHNSEEVESSNFVDINEVIQDINENPDKYTKTTALHIKEYQKRFLS